MTEIALAAPTAVERAQTLSYIIKIYAMRGILGPSGLLNQALIFIGILARPRISCST